MNAHLRRLLTLLVAFLMSVNALGASVAQLREFDKAMVEMDRVMRQMEKQMRAIENATGD